ncbi:MAG: D-alanyl-D-alanine carboxypeptidase family protein, partial [Lachnospiraceae bacterium]|nr:D-alanyl-D-alanine carboxypeptidase family protein [Lachnospiraceae bacterium]
MNISLRVKVIITMCLLTVAGFTFAGCEGFFASPQELFTDSTPTPVPKATDVIPTVVNVTNTNEATPTVEVKPTEGGVPSVTDTPTPVPTDTPVPTATPTPIPTVETNPSEVNTDYQNTYTFIVDRAYPLPSTYEPDDLVPLSECALDYDSLTDPKHKMRKVAAEALTEMFNAAKEEDIHLVAVSGYRSF